MKNSIRGVIFDVDGTLVDSNDAHARAWEEADDPRVEKLGRRRGEIFRARHLPHIRPFPRTRELLTALREAGFKLAVATSAEKEELEPLLERAGASDLIEHKASSDDAESSKPDPDIVLIVST